MAQLAAKERLLYYPTDHPVIESFVQNHLNVTGDGILQILDPCAGEGSAVKKLEEQIKLKNRYIRTALFGIEVEKNRAEAAAKILDVAVNSEFEKMKFQNHPNFIFMNPPYDTVEGVRTELSWIRMVSPLLPGGGTMLLVLPELFFLPGRYNNQLRATLQRCNLELFSPEIYKRDNKDYGAFKFPDPYFDSFKQYILMVHKKSYGNASLEKEIPIEGVIGECTTRISIKVDSRYSSGNKIIVPTFSMAVNTEYKELKTEIKESNSEILFGKVSEVLPISPLQPMRAEIMAAIIAGGMFGGVQIDDEFIVRGGTKVSIEKTEQVSDTGAEETVYTQRMTAHVSQLSLKTGEITLWDSSTTEFGEMIEIIAQKMVTVIEKERPSICSDADIERLKIKFADIKAPRTIPDMPDEPFNSQKIAAATALRCWEETKTAVIFGEMGVGKSITAIITAVAQIRNRKDDAQKIVILLPSKDDIVTKWKEEIATSCRDLKPKIFDLETITDVKEAFENKGLTFILVKESMVKRTSGYAEVPWKGKCFKCGCVDPRVTADGEEPEKGTEDLYCPSCGVSYKTFVRDRNNNAYASLAKYVLDHYAKSYVLIADEAHQFKGGDTARGYASGALIKGAWRVLIMTGTFYNGYASSMYFLLYRGVGSFREENTYDGVKDFVRLYGLEQKIDRKARNTSSSYSGYKNKVTTRTKEIPGIHPSMIGMMLPYTIFMKLADLNIDIPAKSEHTVFFDAPKDVNESITRWLSAIKTEAVSRMKDNGDMSLISQHTWAKAGIHDVYTIGDVVDEFTFPAMYKEKMAPKEEAALRICAAEKARGKATLIYHLQSDRRPVHARLHKWFWENGMRIVNMPSTTKHRVEFIENHLAEGTDAIICNPNLVREGIDLYKYFKTIIWYGVTDDAVLVHQANARIHRIGQDEETKFYYFGYNQTYQSERWTSTAKKVAAMSAMHGDVRTGLAALLGEASMITNIQDVLIDYERRESDLKMDDLPPVIKFAKIDENSIMENIVRRVKKKPVPQIVEFVEYDQPKAFKAEDWYKNATQVSLF